MERVRYFEKSQTNSFLSVLICKNKLNSTLLLNSTDNWILDFWSKIFGIQKFLDFSRCDNSSKKARFFPESFFQFRQKSAQKHKKRTFLGKIHFHKKLTKFNVYVDESFTTLICAPCFKSIVHSVSSGTFLFSIPICDTIFIVIQYLSSI